MIWGFLYFGGAVVMFLPPNFIQLWCTMCPNIHTQCIGGGFQAAPSVYAVLLCGEVVYYLGRFQVYNTLFLGEVAMLSMSCLELLLPHSFAL